MNAFANRLMHAGVAVLAVSQLAAAAARQEPPRNRAELQRAIDSLISQPEFRTAHWGVLVVDPALGDTLYSHNAGKLFLPASNMKLATMATAVTQLGVDYRWTTTVAARGAEINGVLDGDLLVIGRGDPSVSDSAQGDAMLPLRQIADSLYATGLRRVTGRLLATGDAFPGPTIGFGWSWSDLDDVDGAAVDELLFNDGFGTLHVSAGDAVGDVPTVRTAPASTYPAVRVTARTVAPSDTAALAHDSLRVVMDSVLGVFDLQGAIAVGDSAVLPVPFADPDEAYLAALREALWNRGIVVDGGLADSTATVDTLVRVQSPTLGELLADVLKPSQNQMAEMVFRTIGMVETGIGRADSAARVVGDQLVAWGAQPDGFVIRDGSGLARYDYLTPETVVHILDAMRESSDSTIFRGALPMAGVDGTLENRMVGTPAQGNVRAKTGSLSNTRSLSGYVTTADGRQLLFSVLVNSYSAKPAQVTAAQDSIAAWLAGLGAK